MRKKISASNATFLLDELPELLEKELITQDAYQQIQEYYTPFAKTKGIKNNLIIGIFIAICALLTGLGVTLILAHNWDTFGITTRMAMAFVPLAISSALLLIGLKRGAIWRESVAIFHSLCVGGAIAIVAQIYNLGGTLGDFFRIWYILLIPFLLLTSSRALIAIFSILWIWWMASSKTFNAYTSPTDFLLSLIPFIVILYYIVREPKSNVSSFFRYILVIIGIIFIIKYTNALRSYLFTTTLIALISGVWALGCNYYKKIHLLANPLLWISYIVWVVISCYLVSSDAYARNLPDIYMSFAIYATFAIALASLCYAGYKAFKTRNLIYLFPIILCISMALRYSDSLLPIIKVITTIFVVYTGVWGARMGIRKSSLLMVDGAAILLLAIILSYFLNVNLSTLARGILFIVTGVTFGVFNIVLLRRFKKNEEVQP